MQIIERGKVPHVAKDHGTDTWYYIFPEHEVHYNEIGPKAIQPWHHHKKTEEDIFVITGVLRVSWLTGEGEKKEVDVGPGTLVRAGTSVHTISNPTSGISTFLVFKFVPQGINQHELIKNDKVLD